ncbi:DUF932 domain-containing protein [Escherichia coli]|nr:DUF932 domain-containing protein [Escherichia coli]
MSQTERRYDRLSVRLSLIISRLLAGETLNMRKLAAEFGVSERTLHRDFRERLIYLDLEYQDGCCRLLTGGRQEIREEAAMQFARQSGTGALFPDMDHHLVSSLLSSKDSSPCLIWHQMLPGYFRAICTNGLVCGQSFGEVRVPHRGNVVEKVIEGAYEVLGVFDRVEEKRDAMQSLLLPPPAQQAFARAALTYRFGEEHQPVTEAQILTPRRYEDRQDDLWSVFNRCQENLLKGGLPGRTAKGKRSHTRAVKGIDGDVKLNRALWVMAEKLQQALS